MLLLAQVTSEDLAPIDAKGEIVGLKIILKIASLGSAIYLFNFVFRFWACPYHELARLLYKYMLACILG